jgi:GT2 family glycosyltransferase
MDLSIIIVNYNVKHFLVQCMPSVQQAMDRLKEEHSKVRDTGIEVFVVDNNSVDGSVAEIRQKFPWAKVLVNEKNLGFSKANNQAIRESTGPLYTPLESGHSGGGGQLCQMHGVHGYPSGRRALGVKMD